MMEFWTGLDRDPPVFTTVETALRRSTFDG